ncbi:MAG: hypothetical protein EXR67_07675 [Dehalococcoidia bacterium]|nr:hypothetical protein [Dehalococcoidia bacterium]
MNTILERDIDLGRELYLEILTNSGTWSHWGKEFPSWKHKVIELIRRVYGDGSAQEIEFHVVGDFDVMGPISKFDRTQEPAFSDMLPQSAGFTEALLEDIQVRDSAHALSKVTKPWVFVAHGGETPERDRLELLLCREGYHPVIVELMPSLQMSPNAKIDHYWKQCSFGIIFAQADRASTQDGKLHPRLNVVNEIPRVRKTLGNKFIVLLEKGLNMPSNEADAVRESFTSENLEKAFLAVQKEMRGHGIRGTSE